MRPPPAHGHRLAFALLSLLFFSWGFVTVLNDILIPALKDAFVLDNTSAMLVQLAFFGAYFTVSLPAGVIVKKLGYRRGIVFGLLVMALGAAAFWPASAWVSYPLFLGALFVLAGGMTVLQVAANPYVTVLGPPATAASRLNLVQGLNSLGTTVGPLVGTALILDADASATVAPTDAVAPPYLAIAAALVVLALAFARLRLPPVTYERARHVDRLSRHRPLVLGVAAIFFYVGAEVAIGSLLVLFLGLPEIAGLPDDRAGFYVSLYWGAAMVGRFAGAVIQRHVDPRRVLGAAAMGASALVAATVLLQGEIAMWTLLAVGLTNSIMFPTIFSLSIAGMGEHTSRASALLVMAIVGGALIPLAVGVVADSAGYLVALATVIPCYLFIAAFARVVPAADPTRSPLASLHSAKSRVQ